MLHRVRFLASWTSRLDGRVREGTEQFWGFNNAKLQNFQTANSLEDAAKSVVLDYDCFVMGASAEISSIWSECSRLAVNPEPSDYVKALCGTGDRKVTFSHAYAFSNHRSGKQLRLGVWAIQKGFLFNHPTVTIVCDFAIS